MYYQRNYLEFMLITEGAFAVIVYATIGLYKRVRVEQKYGAYLIVGLVGWLIYLAGIVSFQKTYLQTVPEVANSEWKNIYLNSVTKYVVTFVLLTMAKYFKDNFIYQYYENERKKLQTQSELQNLKAQIAPHFLFNTMNNFYGLAVEQSPKLPPLMVRLSELLRYSLYETNQATVPLLSEIAYLKSYIELEKIRLEETLAFEFNVEIDPLSNLEIAPLIFIVFVENAFKHAKNVENDVVKIKIDVSVSNGNELFFSIKNNCLTNAKDVDYNRSGIGLENVRKRLNVLYPNGLHTLNVEKMGDFFEVKLRIKL
jgi:LytS/YehU family sensor histidine kinase